MKDKIAHALATLEEIKSKALGGKKARFTAKADMGGVNLICCEEKSKAEVSAEDITWLNTRIDWLRDDLNYLRSALAEHKDGHLPHLDFSALQKALKLLGMDGEYVIQPKVIYASTGEPTSILLSK